MLINSTVYFKTRNSLNLNRFGIILLLAALITGCSLNEAPECVGEKQECIYDENNGGYVQRVCNPKTQQWKIEHNCGANGCKDNEHCADIEDWCDLGDVRCREENKIGIVEECKNNKTYELKETCTYSCDGNGCGNCINGDVKCVNEGTQGQIMTCVKGKWEVTENCENGYSCKNDGKTCGDCTNGTVTCKENNTDKADSLLTCTDGESHETACTPPSGSESNALGACKTTTECGHIKCVNNFCYKKDTMQCVNTKNACGTDCNDCTSGLSSISAEASCNAAGECVYQCKDGYHNYMGKCDEADSLDHCGLHGKSCHADDYTSVICEKGKCVINECRANYALIPVNGVNLCFERISDPTVADLEQCSMVYSEFDSHIYCPKPASEGCQCLLHEDAFQLDFCPCVSH